MSLLGEGRDAKVMMRGKLSAFLMRRIQITPSFCKKDHTNLQGAPSVEERDRVGYHLQNQHLNSLLQSVIIVHYYGFKPTGRQYPTTA